MTESNARRHDNLGLNMPFTVVQANINREPFVTDNNPKPLPLLFKILFLNKNDLFERKIPTSDIKNFFPASSFPPASSWGRR